MKRSGMNDDAGGERVRSSNGLAGARSAKGTRGADARQAQRAVGRARCPDCEGTGVNLAYFRRHWKWYACHCAGTGKRAQARKRDASVPANK
jgi:hypothetical protein